VAEDITESRRFGAILWTTDDWNEHELISISGLKPLSDFFNAICCMRGPKAKSAYKTVYYGTAKSFGRGVIIYANEALFKSG